MNAEEERATLENLSINTMYLNDAVLLINECQSYTILYKIYFSMCAALTKTETCHIQAHEVCRIHACTMLHTYSIHTAYISATLLHSIHTAYMHTCAHNTCTSILHACCIHKNWLSATRMPYKHMNKCMQFVCNCLHVACMLYINNCMYAAHKLHYSDMFDLMCMYVACVYAEPILCMQHTCYMGDCVCSTRAAYTVFPRIVSALDQYPPSNSARIVCFCQ